MSNFSIIQGPGGRGEMSWDEPVDISTILWTSLNTKKGTVINNVNFGEVLAILLIDFLNKLIFLNYREV